MLDLEMKKQLEEVFSRLESELILRVYKSAHADEPQLLEMLGEVASTSQKIKIEIVDDKVSKVPSFEIAVNGKSSGIFFTGIPGGHEFTSLVLAILNSDGKGKIPDDGIVARVKRLKGDVRLKTYVSLSCENCPEVVQALNLMATLHPSLDHEMIDGAYAQEEVEALGLQGVPSVVLDGKLLHSGKISFSDLLQKLEEQLGSSAPANINTDLGFYDVAVIGGGPAGVTSAIYSARKGLKVAVIADKFGGQVQETKGIENMISVPYTEGPKLAAQLGEHLKQYPVKLLEHRRVVSLSTDHPKKITFASGEVLTADAVIIATGAKWRELGIPGEKEHIGQGVAFCAHCDGPFYKGKKVAVVGGGNSGVEAAIDLAGIVSELTLIEYSDKLKADDVLVQKLKSLPNATIVVNAKTQKIVGDGKKVVGLNYIDRATNKETQLAVDGVFVQIGLLPNSQFVKDILNINPMGEIIVDAHGRTSVPGIYAAGDVTTIPFKQIVTAMGDGAKVALTAFEDRMRGVLNKAA
ncbi:alkyl hydroperoxide reductase subunit F [bacterium]|nr:alkyl hydroperoxide reductase subunit F [bacterium]